MKDFGKAFFMNSTMLIFFATLAACAILYYIVPLKVRWCVLLLASVIFYALISAWLIAFVLLTTVSVYFAARVIQKNNSFDEGGAKKKNKVIISATIILNLGVIGFLKYFNFFGGTLNSLFNLFGFNAQIPALSLALPIGISYYTLEAVGYLIDVYRKKYPAEKNFFKVALFLMFFPQILEGPIARFEQTADRLYAGHRADYKNITFSLQRILWGLFKKMVVADRLYLLVKTISANPTEYSGAASLLFIIFYAFQLYADFSGFIDIAIGAAGLFGVTLPENFRQPFFAKSAQEFWKRWHITLGVWLKEYVFYSVALSPKLNKLAGKLKRWRRNHFTKMFPTIVALFAVWLCNGLWHGPEWKYIVYGLYYFIIISGGMLAEPLIKKLYAKLHINSSCKALSVLRHIRTLIIVFAGETLFGASTLSDGLYILRSVFIPYSGSIFSLGLDYKEFIVAVVGLLIMLGVGVLKKKNISIRSAIAAKALPIRWAVYLSAAASVIIFGAYGGMYSVQPFIYGGF